MKVGFIGVGSMGSLLIEAFIASAAIPPEHIVISNRSFQKAKAFEEIYPGLTAVTSNIEVAKQADLIFLCIKPHHFSKVIYEIKDIVRTDQLIISITSPVLISQLENELSSKIAKIIPSITNKLQNGSTLCIYGQRMKEEDRFLIRSLFSKISEPIEIDENFTRIVSDISSCGPAFFSFFLQKFVDAAVEETGIARDDAVKIASHMLLGTGLLLTEGGMSPEEVQKRVSVPGGITAKALSMLEEATAGIFNELIQTTHAKYNDDLEKVYLSFQKERVNE